MGGMAYLMPGRSLLLQSPSTPQAPPMETAAPPAPAPRADMPLPSGLCGFDWGQIQYEEFSSENPLYGLSGVGGSWPVVWTRPPRINYFWLILAHSWSLNGAGAAISFGLFLVPPAGAKPDPNSLQFFNKDGITGTYRSIPKLGIRVRGGVNFTANTGQSTAYQHFGEFTPGMLIVPPGWALMVAGDQASNGPGVNTSLQMQVAYAELPIGSLSPGFGG